VVDTGDLSEVTGNYLVSLALPGLGGGAGTGVEVAVVAPGNGEPAAAPSAQDLTDASLAVAVSSGTVRTDDGGDSSGSSRWGGWSYSFLKEHGRMPDWNFGGKEGFPGEMKHGNLSPFPEETGPGPDDDLGIPLGLGPGCMELL